MADFPNNIVCGRYLLKSVPATFEMAQQIFDIYDSDAENMIFWMPNGLYKSPEEVLLDYSRRPNRKQFLMFGIFDGDEFLGEIGFSNIMWNTGVAELGYWLKKSARGCGVISNLFPEIEQMGFGYFGFRKLVITSDTENMASRAIAEKFNYVQEGTLRAEGIWPNGSVRDKIRYSKLKAEWEKGKQK